jgi:hypothetical protein
MDAQVIRGALSVREQKLLEMSGRGKSADAISKIYREYGGENGVEEALARIREKLQNAANGHALAGLPDEDDGLGGIPVRSVPAGTLNGAGAAPTSPEAIPPRDTAPAASSDRPSRQELAVRNGSPSHGGARKPLTAEERERRNTAILTYLREHGESGAAAIARAIGIPEGSIKTELGKLAGNGHVACRATGRLLLWRMADSEPAESPGLPVKVDPPSRRAAAPQSPTEREKRAGKGAGLPPIAGDSIREWVAVLDRASLWDKIEEMRLRLDAYERLADALDVADAG